MNLIGIGPLLAGPGRLGTTVVTSVTGYIPASHGSTCKANQGPETDRVACSIDYLGVNEVTKRLAEPAALPSHSSPSGVQAGPEDELLPLPYLLRQ